MSIKRMLRCSMLSVALSVYTSIFVQLYIRVLFTRHTASCAFPRASSQRRASTRPAVERVTFFARAKKVTKESTSRAEHPQEDLHKVASNELKIPLTTRQFDVSTGHIAFALRTTPISEECVSDVEY